MLPSSLAEGYQVRHDCDFLVKHLISNIDDGGKLVFDLNQQYDFVKQRFGQVSPCDVPVLVDVMYEWHAAMIQRLYHGCEVTRGWGSLVRGIVSSFDDGGNNNGNLNHCHLSLHALTTNQLLLSGVLSLQLVLPISFCTLDYNRIKVVDLNHSKLGLPALYFQHNCMISFICLNTSSFAGQQSCSTAYHLQHALTVPCWLPTKGG